MSFLIQTLFSIFLFSLVCSAQASEKTEPVSKQASSIHLTAKERIWLSKHKNIRIAFDGSLPPYSFVNKRGKFDGIAIEIINTVSQRLGIKFKTYPNASWNKLYSAAGKRKVDVVATMVDRPDRRLWFNFTQPYLTKSLVIMTRLDNTTIKNREDLKKKTVALTKGYHYGDVLRRQFPSVKPYYVDDMLNGLKAYKKVKLMLPLPLWRRPDICRRNIQWIICNLPISMTAIAQMRASLYAVIGRYWLEFCKKVWIP